MSRNKAGGSGCGEAIVLMVVAGLGMGYCFPDKPRVKEPSYQAIVRDQTAHSLKVCADTLHTNQLEVLAEGTSSTTILQVEGRDSTWCQTLHSEVLSINKATRRSR